MRITNMLHFSENHHFCIYRDFSLSSMNDRMLGTIYQPMVGAFAIGIYMTLSRQLSSDRVGYSMPEQQRKLFLSLDLEPGERGRKYFIEQTSKLEAVGLLQTTRRYLPEDEDYLYEYQLHEPLSPQEFFKNQHLTLLLRDKIGKYAVLAVHEELISEAPAFWADSNAENLSVPFYDIFQLNTQVIDHELEQALYQTTATTQATVGIDVISKGFDYATIIKRFPRGSRNRDFVEALRYNSSSLAAINIVAKKYDLTLKETCRLLDEDDIFTDDGELVMDVLQHHANLYYRQSKKRDDQMIRNIGKMAAANQDNSDSNEVESEHSVEMAYYLEVPTIFDGQCDIHQYNMLLRNEPYRLMLQRFFPRGSVPDGVLDIFEKIDLNYQLQGEVINVLIHYLHIDRRSWARSSIEAVVSDLLGKHVETYEQAVEYIRERASYKERMAAAAERGAHSGRSTGRGRAAGSSQRVNKKPYLPVIDGQITDDPLTAEELAEMQKLVEELEGNRRG